MKRMLSLIGAALLVSCAAPALAADAESSPSVANDLVAELNMSRCLIEKDAIGKTIIYNVCTDKVSAVVPWTALGWAGFILLSTFITGILLVVVGFIVILIKGY